MSQLQNIEQKDIIKSVTGKIVKLWEPKTLKGPKGDFDKQGGEIEVDGQIYGLAFWNNNQNAELLEGKVVTLSSTRGKMGLAGVSLDHESYSKKDGTKVDRDVIKVTRTGKVSFGEADETVESPRPSLPSVPAPRGNFQSIEDLVNFHVKIDRAVRTAYIKKTDEETLRSYVSSVFIEANRRNITQVMNEDVKSEVEQEVTPEATNTEDWASAIVPSGSNKGKKLIELGRPAITKLYQHYLDKGFTTPFAKCVEAAGDALKLDAWDAEEAEDDIPY